MPPSRAPMEEPRAVPHVVIAPDELEARLVLGPGERLDDYEALIFVARRGVRFGLAHRAIAGVGALTGPAEVVVARALAAREPRHGAVETPLGNTAFPLALAADGQGRVGFVELPLPAMVTAGDVVAVLVPPLPGRAARSVAGTPLGPEPEPARPIAMRAGLGTELAHDGGSVLATMDGNPCCVDGVVTVRQERRFEGDLAYPAPDVRFGGNLLVEGSVTGAIELLAAGDVTVLGDVAGAKIAAGGRVVVHGAIRPGATIVATTDVAAGMVEGASVRGGGALAVRGDLVGTTVEGMRRVLVGGAVQGGRIAPTARLEAVR